MHDVSLLVSSFDKYAVCWQPFGYGLQKYWPNHPQNLYFITNHLLPPMGVAIQVGEDRGWANNLLFALEQIPTPFILYAQEDYWINQPVDEQNLTDYLALLENNQADYIRLYPVPGPDADSPLDYRLGTLAERAAYRTSLQMALWRKDVLKALLISTESPWEFEDKGSFRSQQYGGRFLCVKKRRWGIRYVFTAVVDGEWSKAAYEYAQSEELQIDFSQLPQKPFWPRLQALIKRKFYLRYRSIQKQMTKMRKSKTGQKG
jgi:hypothetical protein